MNTHDNDCIIAIKNYEDIVLSLPLLNENVDLKELPELHKIFLTICILLRDYDQELISLINKKWGIITDEEKIKLLNLGIEQSVDNGVMKGVKEMLEFDSESEIKVKETDPARSPRG